MNSSQKWINCEADFANIDDFLLKNWIELNRLKIDSTSTLPNDF